MRADCSELLRPDELAFLLSLGSTPLLVTDKLLTISSLHTLNWSFNSYLQLSHLKSRWSVQQAMSTNLLVAEEKSLNPLDSHQNSVLQKSASSFQILSLLARKLWLWSLWMRRMGLLPTSSSGTSLTHILSLSSFFFFPQSSPSATETSFPVF